MLAGAPIDLHIRWLRAHAGLGMAANIRVLAELVEAWSEAGRHYHALPHLERGLEALDRYGADVALVQMAWFFHDAVYVVGRPDNELLSADWFSRYVEAQGLAANLAARGRELILATRDHQGATLDDPLWPIMNDVDLGVFAADREAYDAYAAGVWLEYQPIVARRPFVLGRAAFMSAFASRPIYLTGLMKPEEERARANIAAEVAALMQEAEAEGWTAPP